MREVMRTSLAVIPQDARRGDLVKPLHADHNRGQKLYPIVDASLRLIGVVTRKNLQAFFDSSQDGDLIGALGQKDPVVAYQDEPLRIVVYRMAESGKTRLPVVDREDPGKLLGMISLNDLLRARTRDLEEERTRERVLRLRLPFRSVPVRQ